MSSIKPPDGRVPGASNAPSAPEGSPAGGVQRSGGDFEAALDAAEHARAGSAANAAARASDVQQASGVHAPDPIAELARAVRAGAVSKEQALEQLIERAAAGVQHTLSAPQRAELVAVLRSSLQTDPALSALREALEG
jgi:hypothetical protein